MLLKLAGFFITWDFFFHLISFCEVRLLKLSSENAPADGWKNALWYSPYHCYTYKSREYRPALQEVLDCSLTMWKSDYETFTRSEVHLFNNPWKLD